ncbi:MAG: fatty acid desaturase, partial [Planctomycetes bacterium]|nr:fatty acid desaturase [Planctomycetota bacterium]
MTSPDTFSIPQARRLLNDLFQHRLGVYWTDFLVSLTIGYACAGVYLSAPLGSPQQVVCFLVAGFALFRVGSFIHEIVHFGRGQMTAFHAAWDILAGVPMLM